MSVFSRRDLWIGAALVVAIVAVYLGSLALAPSGAEFAGTDAAATELAGGPRYGPLLSLSPELESGLFALQAGLGGLLLGFVLGRLTARRRS
ncbi:energy-coupling factor ABC transporter substrate-binding protein [Tessaracoccus sp. G1721]